MKEETKQLIAYIHEHEPSTWEEALFMTGFNRSYTRKGLTEEFQFRLSSSFYNHPRTNLEGIDLDRVSWYQVARAFMKTKSETVRTLIG